MSAQNPVAPVAPKAEHTPGFRELSPNEIVHLGDQYRYGKDDAGNWIWRVASDRLGHPAGPACVYRRRTTPQRAVAHSPAPWRLDFEKHYSGAEGFRVAKTRCQSYAIYAGRKCIAAVITAWRASDPQSVADGVLMAASPDLLRELRRLTDLIAIDPDYSAHDLTDARKAIAKAEGRA